MFTCISSSLNFLKMNHFWKIIKKGFYQEKSDDARLVKQSRNFLRGKMSSQVLNFLSFLFSPFLVFKIWRKNVEWFVTRKSAIFGIKLKFLSFTEISRFLANQVATKWRAFWKIWWRENDQRYRFTQLVRRFLDGAKLLYKIWPPK